MPRYYFHLRDDLSADDEEGLDLPSPDAARARAEAFARALIAASVLERGLINLAHRIDVANEEGRDVLTVTFGDVVAVDS